jgi:predicted component of type VI protein secretion system
MELLLKVIDGPSSGNWRGLEARFDASGGLIGRAETARLSLPDSSRTVSRFHTHVSCSGDAFFLEEMGSRNAAIINGKALKVGIKEQLRSGDQVKIGHFTIAVEIDDPSAQGTDSPGLADGPAGPNDAARTREGAGMRSPSSNAELLNAFQDGAGVHLETATGLHPEFMRTLGLILRTLVGGIQRLTSQRMRLREEGSPEKARPQSRHVDPIRAAAEESRSLAALFKAGVKGPEGPQVKAQEMIDDLAARLAAMRTAVNTAVEQTEARLAPSAVEERLQSSLFLDELLPMRRKARLWDLYREAARSEGKADGKSDAKSDDKAGAASAVRELFNTAFARAYEAEVSRLRKDRAPSGQ